MITMWYDYAWGATFVRYRGIIIKVLDTKAIRKILWRISKMGHEDGEKLMVPYSKEVWADLLALGVASYL